MIINNINPFLHLLEINQKANMIIAEIGVADGETTITYLPLIQKNNGKVYAIDWFKGNKNVNKNHKHGYNISEENNKLLEFKNIISEYSNIVTILHGDSIEMSNNIQDESLDICFIDSDHSYYAIKKDIETYYKKVKKGGILCGHDCEKKLNETIYLTEEEKLIDCNNDGHIGVIKSVYDFFKDDYEVLVEGIGSYPSYIWIHYKK